MIWNMGARSDIPGHQPVGTNLPSQTTVGWEDIRIQGCRNAVIVRYKYTSILRTSVYIVVDPRLSSIQAKINTANFCQLT